MPAQRLLQRYLGRQRLGDPAHEEDAARHEPVLLVAPHVAQPVDRIADVELDVRDVALRISSWAGLVAWGTS